MSITKISPSVVDFDAGITITVDDNSDTLTLTSTDADNNSAPYLRMYRNSASPADADPLTRIKFDGRNDNSQDVTYGYIQVFSTDVSDGTEDGTIDHYSIVGGTARNRISISPTETVLNEDSRDLDFRVESDNDTHALFVNGADGNVGIGATPASWASTWEVLQVGAKGAVTSQNGDVLQLSENTYHDGSNWKAVGTDAASLVYLDGGLTIFYHAPSVSADANQTWSEKMRVTSNGLTFNGDTAAANALDDYEEGTWTPAIAAGGWSINTTPSATYTKIGRAVNIQCYTSITGTGNSTALKLSGLPFNSASNHFAVSKLDAELVNTHGAYVRTDAGTDDMLFLTSEESTSTGRTTLAGNEFGAGYLIFSFTYFV